MKPKRITAQQTRDMNDDAVAAFKKLSGDLTKLGRDPADYDHILKMAADSWAEFQQARRHVDEHGVMLENGHGNQYRNPATAIKKDAKASMMACLVALGFTAKERNELAKAVEAKPLNQHGDDV